MCSTKYKAEWQTNLQFTYRSDKEPTYCIECAIRTSKCHLGVKRTCASCKYGRPRHIREGYEMPATDAVILREFEDGGAVDKRVVCGG